MASRSLRARISATRFSSVVERVGEPPAAQSDQDDDQDDDDRSEVEQEVVERQAAAAGDDDVGRVADQGGGAADVRGEHLGQQVGHHGQGQPFAEQDGDRRDQQDRGDVVQQCRCHRGDEDQQHHQWEGPTAGPFGRPDCEVLEHAGLAHDADDDHHAEEQEDDVPVDAGLLGEEGGFGVADPEASTSAAPPRAAAVRVDPLLGGDQDVGAEEDHAGGDRGEHVGHVRALSFGSAHGRTAPTRLPGSPAVTLMAAEADVAAPYDSCLLGSRSRPSTVTGP